MKNMFRQKSKLIIGIAIAAAIVIGIFVVLEITVKPVITLNGEVEISVEYQSTYRDSGAVATLWNKDVSDEIEVSGNVDTSKVGTYEIDYTVNYHKREYTEKRIVHVVDTTAPELTLKGKETVTVYDINEYEEPGFEAVDNYDGDVTSRVESTMEKLSEGSYVVHYEATDSSGNKVSAERKVEVKERPQNTDPKNAVYLTFDDGPSSDVTEQILDILKKNNVKATFFIVDYSSSKKDLIQRMIDEGHTIGIHGYSHEYSEIYTSTDVFMDNIHKLRDKIKEDTGYEAFVIRFPGGASNTISKDYCPGIMTKLTKLVEQEGLSYFDWNVDSGDAEGNNREKSILVHNVIDNLKKNRNNVVLMHDTSAKQTTPDAVQSIINYGKKNGYSFYAISKDTIPVHHSVNN